MFSGDVFELLKRRYPPAEYALVREVANGTGAVKVRTADAIAVSLWPSRGIEINGFEIKVSRSDWLRELKQPAKADPLVANCDRWWVVAGGQDIVKLEELPQAWGLLVAKGGKLHAARQAPPLREEIAPMNRAFVAALLRAAMKQSPAEAEIAAAVRAERDRNAKEHEENKERWRIDGRHEAEILREAIDEFEKASGVKITGWNGGRIGGAVKVVLDGGIRQQRLRLQLLRESANKISVQLNEAMSDLEAKLGADEGTTT